MEDTVTPLDYEATHKEEQGLTVAEEMQKRITEAVSGQEKRINELQSLLLSIREDVEKAMSDKRSVEGKINALTTHADKLKGTLANIRQDETMQFAKRVEAELLKSAASIKSSLEKDVMNLCREANNAIEEEHRKKAATSPLILAVGNLIDCLNEKHVPSEQQTPIIEAFINSTGYLMWQEGAKGNAEVGGKWPRAR